MRPGDYDVFPPSPPPEPQKGEDGKSAYEIAVEHGYVGSESDWINYVQANGDGAARAQEAAESARDAAANSAAGAETSATVAESAASAAEGHASKARQAASAASESEVNAGQSEQAASGYRNDAQASAEEAADQALRSTKRADEAKDAQIRARESERLCAEMYTEIMRAPKAAEEYARQAGASAESASASAISASESAASAGASAESAASSLTDIQTGLASKLGKNETAVNAEKVNGFTVGCDVPADAVFTDTTYTKMSAEAAQSGTDNTGRLISAKVLADYVVDVVTGAVASLVNSSPAALDTLKELADALGNDPNFAATMATALGEKLGKTETAVNAAKVNNLTVETAVPANAVFTDTTYTDFVGSGSSAAAGLVPSPGSTAGTAKYLREDGSWQVPPDNNTTYSDFVGSGSTAAAGLVPAPSTTAGTTKYLREDGTWQVPPDTNTTYSNATTSAAGLMSATDKTILDGVPTTYATLSDMNTLATTATNSVTAAVNAKNDAVAAKNTAQSIADGLASIRDTAVDTSLAISGQAADSKTVGDKFDVIGATSATNNEYLCVWLDSANRVLFGVKADGSFYWQKGIPKVLKDELDGIKARLTALEA